MIRFGALNKLRYNSDFQNYASNDFLWPEENLLSFFILFFFNYSPYQPQGLLSHFISSFHNGDIIHCWTILRPMELDLLLDPSLMQPWIKHPWIFSHLMLLVKPEIFPIVSIFRNNPCFAGCPLVNRQNSSQPFYKLGRVWILKPR